MSNTIQIRVDDDLKKKSDSLFRDLGTDTTTAIRMFLTQAVANNGFPFEIKKETPKSKTLIFLCPKMNSCQSWNFHECTLIQGM